MHKSKCSNIWVSMMSTVCQCGLIQCLWPKSNISLCPTQCEHENECQNLYHHTSCVEYVDSTNQGTEWWCTSWIQDIWVWRFDICFFSLCWLQKVRIAQLMHLYKMTFVDYSPPHAHRLNCMLYTFNTVTANNLQLILR